MVHLVLALELYKSDFEKSFIEQTALHYQIESAKQLALLPLAEYVSWAAGALALETERVNTCLDRSTLRRTLEILHRDILAEHSTALIESPDLKKQLLSNDVASLRSLHELLRPIDVTAALRAKWTEHLRVRGAELLNEAEKR